MIALILRIASLGWSWGTQVLGGRIWIFVALTGVAVIAAIAGTLVGYGGRVCEARHAEAALQAKQQDEQENQAIRARAQARELEHAQEIATLKERNNELEQALSQIKPDAGCARCRVGADELRLLNR